MVCSEKEKYFLSDAEVAQLEKVVDLDRVLKVLKEENIIGKESDWKKIPFYKAKPSPEAEDGFKGRIGIHEVLKVTPTIRDLVMRNSNSSEIEAQAKKEGLVTMVEDGIFKAVSGLTTIEEVLRVISE